jgi:hypothetical protein
LVVRVRHQVSAALLLCATLCSAYPSASAEPERADLLKAGYLPNFVKFVDWPADTLTLCFIGAPEVRHSIEENLGNKRAGARRLAVRELGGRASAAGCNVLYIDSAAGTRENVVARGVALPDPGVLTVGDSPDFVRHGGVIGLFTQNNRLKFNVNVGNARREGLKVSRALLQLASTIEK